MTDVRSQVEDIMDSIHSCRITCERSESARRRRIALYENGQQQQQRKNEGKDHAFEAVDTKERRRPTCGEL